MMKSIMIIIMVFMLSVMVVHAFPSVNSVRNIVNDNIGNVENLIDRVNSSINITIYNNSKIDDYKQKIRNDVKKNMTNVSNKIIEEVRNGEQLVIKYKNDTKNDTNSSLKQLRTKTENIHKDMKKKISEFMNGTNKSISEKKENLNSVAEKIQLKNGKSLEISKENSTFLIKALGKNNTFKVRSKYEIKSEETEKGIRLKLKLENNDVEVKVMPEVAFTKAIERLKLNACKEEGCKIELKPLNNGNNTRAVYEVKARKKAKLFGIFSTGMDVSADVDAETGDIRINKPWWSFLALEEN